jgi:hypothetical protein
MRIAKALHVVTAPASFATVSRSWLGRLYLRKLSDAPERGGPLRFHHGDVMREYGDGLLSVWVSPQLVPSEHVAQRGESRPCARGERRIDERELRAHVDLCGLQLSEHGHTGALSAHDHLLVRHEARSKLARPAALESGLADPICRSTPGGAAETAWTRVAGCRVPARLHRRASADHPEASALDPRSDERECSRGASPSSV